MNSTDTNQEVRDRLNLAAKMLTKQSLTPEERCFDALSAVNSALAALASAPPPAVPDAVVVREALVLRVGRLIAKAEERELFLRTDSTLPFLREVHAALSSIEPTPSPEPQAVPADVRALVIAARAVAFGDTPRPSLDAMRALDTASEAFASRVPWEDEP